MCQCDRFSKNGEFHSNTLENSALGSFACNKIEGWEIEKMKKYKLVLDCPDKGVIQFDIRGKSGAIGHLVLTETGLAWKPKHKQKISGSEIPWENVPHGMSEMQKKIK